MPDPESRSLPSSPAATPEPLTRTLAWEACGVFAAAVLFLSVRGKRLLAGLGAAWALGAFGVYYVNRPLHLFISWPWDTVPGWWMEWHRGWGGFPLDVAGQGLLAGWCLAVALLLGGRLFGRFFPEADRLERAAWGGGLCLGLWGTAVFCIALLGGLAHPRAVFGGLLLAMSAAAVLPFQRRAEREGERRTAPDRLSRTETGALVFLLALQCLGFLYALTPSVQSDELRYHLAAPQEWLKAGRLAYLPYNAFSNFPSTVEMLFLFGLGLGGDLLAKCFHFFFLPLSTAAVFLFVRRFQERTPGGGGPRLGGVRPAFLAAFAWGTLPLALPLAGWAFIDLAVLFFQLGMVYFLWRWFAERSARCWVGSALFAGLLCASKYTGLVPACLACVLLLAEAFRPGGALGTPLRGRLRRVCLFGLILAALAGPWWGRNLANTGNPVYPMAWSLFGGGEWDAGLAASYAEKTREKGIGTPFGNGFVSGLRDLGSLPWETALRPERFESFEIGPLYWVFAPWIALWCLAALARWRKRPENAFLALWLVFSVVFWLYTYQSNRFLLPGWAFALIILALALGEAARRSRGLAWLCALAAALPLLYGCVDSARWLLFDTGRFTVRRAGGQLIGQSGALWPAFVTGHLPRGDYLAAHLPYYRIAEFCGRNLGEDAKVLLVGEHRKMHWTCRVEGNDWFDHPRILPYLAEALRLRDGAADAAAADSLLDALRRDGFTHLFFNLDEWGWPRDSARQSGDQPVPAGSAWSYNRKHFTRPQIELLQRLLDAPRLRPAGPSAPARRIFLAEILPDR